MPGCGVSLSSDIVPQIREYYRLSTTVINAYLEPILARYIDNLDARLAEARREDAAEIHHAVERRHGDLRGDARKKPWPRYFPAPAGGITAERARLPHDRVSEISSPSTWAARPATSR